MRWMSDIILDLTLYVKLSLQSINLIKDMRPKPSHCQMLVLPKFQYNLNF